MVGENMNDNGYSRRDLLTLGASCGIFTLLGGSAAEAATTSKPAAAAPSSVVGAWRLVSFEAGSGDKAIPRFGAHPTGYLLYTASGRMSAVLSATHRPALEPPQSVDAPARGDCEHAVADFLAYAGRYEIRGNHVLHHVEVSVFTNLVGTTLERQFTLEGDTLTIRTLPPEIWGTANTLVWKRA
jgi:hypothetical protein